MSSAPARAALELVEVQPEGKGPHAGTGLAQRRPASRPGERLEQVTARAVALEALVRIDDGAYANLVLPALLDRSGLDERDRDLVTELVYGTTRMRRACDWLVDRSSAEPTSSRSSGRRCASARTSSPS